ncbi:MAG: HAD family hydrolase [Thermofilum sp.]|jgi:FMN phosphatase YigB (HAD superfamily)|nr:HAD family hydrolase [Thermofilum sp.]
MSTLESIINSAKVFSFDIDGTLIDSYTYMRDVIQILLLYLGVPASMLEMLTDEVYRSWYELEKEGVLDYGKFHYLLEDFARKHSVSVRYDVGSFQELLFEARVKGSELCRCAVKLLSELKKRGKIVVSVSAGDGVPGMKHKRIIESGLAPLFDRILVVQEDVPSRVEAWMKLEEEFKTPRDEIVHVDDRPRLALEAFNAGLKAIVVKTGFYDPYFNLPGSIPAVDSLCTLLDMVVKLPLKQ